MPHLNLNGLAIKKALWITDHLRREMRKRDFLKKKAMLDQYKRAWNQTNNEMKKAKRKYFIDNLELSKSNPKKNLVFNQ